MKRLLNFLKTTGGTMLVGLAVLAGFCVQKAQANNIRIIGLPTVSHQDTVKNTIRINFDLAWDNSWRTSKPANHDAAWIFVKCWDGESWNHVYLMDDKDSCVAGVKTVGSSVSGKCEYKVTSRDGKEKKMDMVLEPGYSTAWREWKMTNPEEDPDRCVVGFFLYRKDFGTGDVVVPAIRFTWQYGLQGFVDEDDFVVKVFAVEMVYIPEGPYWLGGKGTAEWQRGSFTSQVDGDGNPVFGTPFLVTQAYKGAAIPVGKANGKLWAMGDSWGTPCIEECDGEIPADFPNGYKAFYIMKYEMTQEAYCEFLNTLSQGQQDGRIEGRLAYLGLHYWTWTESNYPMDVWRNYIRMKRTVPTAQFGVDANNNQIYNETMNVEYRPGEDSLVMNIDGQDIAMNLVSVRDMLAYAEFAGLRPMTELEYEKACRGPRDVAVNEYAWGSVSKVFYGQAFQRGWIHNGGGWTARNGNIYNWNQNADDGWGFRDINTGVEKTTYEGYNVGYTRSYDNHWWTSHWSYFYPAPLRVGIFADSTSTRTEAGATFWGVMNMSDNVAEICISVVDSVGRKFKGTHGCGQLGSAGEATHADWAMPTLENKYTYFITRGMAFHHNAVNIGNSSCWWSCCWGDQGGWNGDWVWWGANSDNDLGFAGMISSRHRARQGTQELNQRDYFSDGCGGGNQINVNYPIMLGIRCVRSENGE